MATPRERASRDRSAGSLLGLAIGDALGTTLEFHAPGTFEPIADMVGGGPFRLLAGQWTDDTSMALCLAESILECQGFDPGDQMRRYCRWMHDGHLSVTGHCFDIGNTVHDALTAFEGSGEPMSGATHPRSAGNGSLMRLAPVPIAWQHAPAQAVALSASMSRTTHGAPEAVDACRYYAGLLVGALAGVGKDRLLAARFEPVPGCFDEQPLAPAIAAIADGAWHGRQPPAIRGTGYVVQSLEAALWALRETDDFAQGALAAANLGDDADTTAAIYGQLAGALYGLQGLPAPWRERVAWADRIGDMALALADFSDAGRARQTTGEDGPP